MNLDTEQLHRAVRETRGKTHDRVIVALNALTYSYWWEPFRAFQRADRRVEFLIDHRVQSGCIGVRACPDSGPEGAEVVYDLREKTRSAGE